MKWLTLQAIRKHLHIDYDCEDDLLELYGESAEQTILLILNRSFEELLEVFGTQSATEPGKILVPAPIIQASLLVVGNSYLLREASTTQNINTTLYGVDALIKPYMKLG